MASTQLARAEAIGRSTEKEGLPIWVFVVAASYFLLHMLTASRYGYFRDALYYLACSEHLDWGYVDQPPLIALIAWVTRHALGTSLPALIFWPSLAGAARILLTARFARELGASRFGISLAAVLGAVPAVWYVVDHQFAMNAFETLFWTGCAFLILRMIKTGNLKLWLAFGALSGLGLENKYSMSVFAFALLAGLLLTKQRKLFFTPWLFAGGTVALLIFLPNLLWNIHHHWPFAELMRNIRESGRDVALSPLAFLGQQILIISPMSFPLWFGGLLYYFFGNKMKDYRVFGWAFSITILFFLLAHGKNYYPAPAYTLVMAGAGVAAERWLMGGFFLARRALRIATQVLCVAIPIVGKALLLPVVLPVLPVETYLKFQEHLPFEVPRSEHGHMGAALPQHYADEFGWEEMVAATSRVYHALTPEEQAKTAIFANNYGEAGAIDLFGPKYGLPRAISGHQNYFLWGPRNYTGEIVIVLGSADPENDRTFFTSVQVVEKLDNPYALPSENRAILLCRGLKWNLQEMWPKVKKWN
jgi:hypothetical protein